MKKEEMKRIVLKMLSDARAILLDEELLAYDLLYLGATHKALRQGDNKSLARILNAYKYLDEVRWDSDKVEGAIEKLDHVANVVLGVTKEALIK